jgi:GMP synthase (glutamine-hydrolysing)
MRKALAISHLAFEDLGTLAVELRTAGFAIEILDACNVDFSAIDSIVPDLVVVLGGPIGVYEREKYPFLDAEIEWIHARLAAERPVLGICLGAQLMAAALGARVYPGQNGKEIGWAPIQPGRDAARHPEWAALLTPELCLLHWHGDTFDLPAGVHHLAASKQYPNQAFSLGQKVLGLQFHLEVTAADLEHWYVGHACELAHAGVSVPQLRRQSRIFAPQLELHARKFWRGWLAAALD